MESEHIPHVERQLTKLQSSNKNQRYDACEMLRVAPSLPEHAIRALEGLLHDPDPEVADAAWTALAAHTSEDRRPPRPTSSERAKAIQQSTPLRPTTLRDWLDPTRLYNPTIPAGRLLLFWGLWLYPLACFVVLGICGALLAASASAIGGIDPFQDPSLWIAVLLPLAVAYVVAGVNIQLRRLKDLDASGWNILLNGIPLVGIVFALWLLLAPSKIASSGLTPRPDQERQVSRPPRREPQVTPTSQQTAALVEDERKRCPYCAEWIMKQAIVCRYCGREIGQASLPAVASEAKPPEVGSEASQGPSVPAAPTESDSVAAMAPAPGSPEKHRLPALLYGLVGGMVMAVLPSIPNVSLLLLNPVISDAMLEAVITDLCLHFIANWIIWGGVIAGLVAIYRKLRKA